MSTVVFIFQCFTVLMMSIDGTSVPSFTTRICLVSQPEVELLVSKTRFAINRGTLIEVRFVCLTDSDN